jgi:hypothetical protein
MKGMPTKDFTVEFWAQTPAFNATASEAGLQNFRNFFSYATHLPESSPAFCEAPSEASAWSLLVHSDYACERWTEVSVVPCHSFTLWNHLRTITSDINLCVCERGEGGGGGEVTWSHGGMNCHHHLDYLREDGGCVKNVVTLKRHMIMLHTVHVFFFSSCHGVEESGPHIEFTSTKMTEHYKSNAFIPLAGSDISSDVFVDDAIRIEKYYREYRGSASLGDLSVHTAGALSVHINANRDGNGQRFDHWLDYAVGWCCSLPLLGFCFCLVLCCGGY